MNKKYTTICLAGMAALLMSSCGSYKRTFYGHYQRPASIDSVAHGLFRDTVAGSSDSLALGDTLSTGNLHWREVFTDPQLQTLIEKALKHNQNLQSAQLTVEQVETALKSAKLAFYPSLQFSPSGTVSKFGSAPASKIYSLPVQASWVVDIFGKYRNAKESAKEQLAQSKAYVQSVRSQIITNIANAYYTLLMLDREVQITEETKKNWEKIIPVMENMKPAGMTTTTAINQSKANIAAVEAQIPALKQSIRETENGICLLMGEVSHPIERGSLENQQLNSSFSAGVPLQSLGNRPDVRMAEATLASAFYGVSQAKANFYPSLTVTAEAAFTNNGGIVVNPGKWLLSAIASLTQPLFANGKLKYELKAAQVQEKQAELAFQQTLLQAGQEVSNAMFAYQIADQKANAHAKQVKLLEEALANTKEQMVEANTTVLEILTAQQSLLSAQLQQVQDKFDSLQSYVSLYSALGGGRNE